MRLVLVGLLAWRKSVEQINWRLNDHGRVFTVASAVSAAIVFSSITLDSSAVSEFGHVIPISNSKRMLPR
jgi:hypothetical protein